MIRILAQIQPFKKNITYPTDAKLRKQVIDKCVTIAKKEGITLRRSYKRTVKQLVRDTTIVNTLKELKKPDQPTRNYKPLPIDYLES